MIASGGIMVVAVDGGTLTRRSFVGPPFEQHSHYQNAGEAFVDDGAIIWAIGPGGSTGQVFCPLPYSAETGITSTPECVPAPPRLMGVGSGGFWMRIDPDRPLKFFRPSGPTIDLVPELQLPSALTWRPGGLPWTTDPNPLTLRVPRIDGSRVVIDEYQRSANHSWAGANERWVFETAIAGDPSTRVYAR